MLRVSSLSRVYVFVPVTGSGDITALPVELAFTGGGMEPENDDWAQGDWQATTPPRARVLIGPDSLVLPEGVYTVWVRVTGPYEQPVLRAGSGLEIY